VSGYNFDFPVNTSILDILLNWAGELKYFMLKHSRLIAEVKVLVEVAVVLASPAPLPNPTGSLKVMKRNNHVVFEGVVNYTVSGDDNRDIGTIPEGYRPSIPVAFIVFVTGSTGPEKATCLVTTSGVVSVTVNYEGAISVYLSAVQYLLP
jgi:hypothetical protein